MTLVNEASARYHKIVENEPYIDLGWAEALQQRIKAEKLVNRPVSPVLRPHWLTRRDAAGLERAALLILSAIHHVEQMVLASPQLLARLQLLPAERMLATVDPRYSLEHFHGCLLASVYDGKLHFDGYRPTPPADVIYADRLADLYYEAAPVKEFRKKHKLSKLSSSKALLSAILKAYKASGGKQKKPVMAIVEITAPFQPLDASENALVAAALRNDGLDVLLTSPDQLEYRNGELRCGETLVNIVFRCFRLQEFLVRFDLNHSLMRAYKEGAICMLNHFRADISGKRGLFELLTDPTVTAGLPASERKAIQDYLPWTRMVHSGKATHGKHTVDLIEHILKHRAKLVLRPNDVGSDLETFRGADLDDAGWEKAVKQATRNPYVVQEIADPARAVFPLVQYGSLVMKDMQVEIHPHIFAGKLQSLSANLRVAGNGSFSTLSGQAPVMLLDGK